MVVERPTWLAGTIRMWSRRSGRGMCAEKRRPQSTDFLLRLPHFMSVTIVKCYWVTVSWIVPSRIFQSLTSFFDSVCWNVSKIFIRMHLNWCWKKGPPPMLNKINDESLFVCFVFITFARVSIVENDPLLSKSPWTMKIPKQKHLAPDIVHRRHGSRWVVYRIFYVLCSYALIGV